MTITGKLGWTALASTAAAIALGVYLGGPAAQASNENQNVEENTVPAPSADAPLAKAPAVKATVPKAQASKAQASKAQKGKPQIAWQSDLATAQRVSAQSDKPVMIVFGATWCGACKMLKQKTLTDARVAQAAQQWVTVEIDTDKEPKIAAQYGIKSLPTTVFFKGDSKKFGFVGAAGPEDMLNVMQAAYSKIQGAPNAQS